MNKPIDPLYITDRDRLLEMMAQRRNGRSRRINEREMNAALKRRIRGQDHIVDHLCSHIRRQYGKENRSTPVANLFFVGPPATGKTELAKAMAEYLFGLRTIRVGRDDDGQPVIQTLEPDSTESS